MHASHIERSAETFERFRKEVTGIAWEAILSALCIPIVKIRSSGTIYTLSPFVFEWHASCVFWPQSGRFLCHASGLGGDKFTFLLQVGFECAEPTHDMFEESVGRFPQWVQRQLADLLHCCRSKNLNPQQLPFQFVDP